MTAKKIISVLQASAQNVRQFTCPAETDPSEDVVLLFKNGFTTKNLEVVRLSVEGLPTMHRNEKIDWITNFGIRQKGSSDKYVDVAYTVFIKPRPNRLLVYFDGKEVKPAPISTSVMAESTGKIAVELNLGDPGVGWDGMT